MEKPPAKHGQARRRPQGSPLFEEFYRAQRIVPEAEWPAFLAALKTSLPACFRVTAGRYADQIRAKLGEPDAWALAGLEVDDGAEGASFAVAPPAPVDWLPEGYAWSINAPRPVLRKCPQLKAFHQWLVAENGAGNINRQEAVSMIPPLLLDVKPGMSVLDLCAAPGSKTAQLVDLVQGGQPHARDRGLVVANDVDTSRCYMLVHQLKRFSGDSIMVTNHPAQAFPLMRRHGDGGGGLQFDRVLCDVPCTGDGTIRKSPDIWHKWKPANGLSLHKLQLSILIRGVELCAVGGRVVYSTCSFNPYENEAVVAAAVRRFNGKLVVCDVAGELPNLKRSHGLSTWRVRAQEPAWYDRVDDVPAEKRGRFPSSVWPPSTAEEAEALGLRRCIRCLPHLSDSGGFFVCVLELREPLLPKHNYNLGAEDEPERQPQHAQRDSPESKRQRRRPAEGAAEPAAEPAAAAAAAGGGAEAAATPQPEPKKARPDVAGSSERVKGPRGRDLDPRELQYEPVALDSSIASLGPHYGLPGDFPFHLLYRRGNDEKAKKLCLVSGALQRVLAMDGEKQLKIVNAGVVLLKRTMTCMHDEQWGTGSEGNAYRLSHESIGLMLPLLGKRVVLVGRADMRVVIADAKLLDGRTVIGPADKSALCPAATQRLAAVSPGCCVLVLAADGADDAEPAPDATRLAICTWKGWERLTVFVPKDELAAVEAAIGC